MSENGAAEDAPADSMQYAILGQDPESEAQKLEKYSGVVGWDYLRPHFESGALLYVDPSLVLAEVAVAIAGDDTERVARWLKAGDLLKPGEPHVAHWTGSEEAFSALVVSPFVLMQPVPKTDG